jgi:rhodanese-related sulfurtransferase
MKRILLLTLLSLTAPFLLIETKDVYANPPAIETAEEEGIITQNSFLKIMAEAPDSVYWIDTRDISEINADGTFANARQMDIHTLKKEIGNLPSDKPIIFFCSTGARAGEAYDLVKLKRPDLQVYFLDASVEFRKQALPLISPPQ